MYLCTFFHQKLTTAFLESVFGVFLLFFFCVLSLTTGQPLRVILCYLPEKGRKEIVEEMKKKDREKRGTGMKVKKQKK